MTMVYAAPFPDCPSYPTMPVNSTSYVYSACSGCEAKDEHIADLEERLGECTDTIRALAKAIKELARRDKSV